MVLHYKTITITSHPTAVGLGIIFASFGVLYHALKPQHTASDAPHGRRGRSRHWIVGILVHDWTCIFGTERRTHYQQYHRGWVLVHNAEANTCTCVWNAVANHCFRLLGITILSAWTVGQWQRYASEAHEEYSIRLHKRMSIQQKHVNPKQ